ncbi:MAG: hypothetical protein RIC51_07990 [Erythrobacter sp.]
MAQAKDWSLRLARIEDAEAMPAIEARAARMFAEVEGLAELAGGETVTPERLRR